MKTRVASLIANGRPTAAVGRRASGGASQGSFLTAAESQAGIGKGRRLQLVGLLACLALLLLTGLLPASASAKYVLSSPSSLCTGTGEGAGQCGDLKGVAVDQSNGNVYVVDPGNFRIDQFQADGTFVRAFGWKVRLDNPLSEPQVCTAITGCQKGETSGTPQDGQFSSGGSRGIAVDPETHIVYVVSSNSVPSKVAIYNGSTGDYIGTLTGEQICTNATAPTCETLSPKPAVFSSPAGIAVDTSNSLQHYLYVASGTNASSVVDKFKVPVVSAGVMTSPPTYVCQITGHTTASSSECHGSASMDDTFDGIAFAGPQGANLAVDASGNVFIAEAATRSRATEFDSSGAWVKKFTATTPVAVAAGASGQIFVASGGTAQGGTKVQEFSVATGSLVSEFETGVFGSTLGVAVDTSGLGANGHVYVSDRTNHTIWNYSTGTAGPPLLEEQKSSEIGGVTAKLEAKINPNHGAVNAAAEHFPPAKDCEFRYSTDPAFLTGIQKKSCENPSNLGGGASGVLTSATLTSLSPVTTYYWKVYAASEEGQVESSLQSFTTPHEPPSVITDAVGPITETTAVLNGHVDNHGAPAGSACSFQVTRASDPTFATPVTTAQCNVNPVTGSGSQAVTATATGLSPNIAYIYRVVASNEGSLPGKPSNGASQSFTTFGRPQIIIQQGAPEGAGAIALAALVDPAGLSTTLHFQYVDEETFEADQPDGFAHARETGESDPIGSDHGAHYVAQTVDGLAPGVTYHFRAVAQNANGTSFGPAGSSVTTGQLCANEAIRVQQNKEMGLLAGDPAFLPQCRAYEMATPPFKQSQSAGQETNTVISPDESAVGFQSTGLFADAQSSYNGGGYVASRTSSGWSTSSTNPPFSLIATTSLLEKSVVAADLRRAVACGIVAESSTMAERDETRPFSCVLRKADGTWIATPPRTPISYPSTTGASFRYPIVGASADLSHVVVEPAAKLLASDTSASGTGSLYEYVGLESGSPELRQVNVDNSGNPIGPTVNPVIGSTTDTNHAVSNDGSTIYFTTTPTGGTETLYARVNGTTTTTISNPSPSECTTCNPSVKAPVFRGASADGTKVFFTTEQQLVNADTDSAADIYEYDFEAGPGHHIVQVSGGGAGDPHPGSGAELVGGLASLGVVQTSNDGSHVYFIAKGLLTTLPNALGQTATEGAANIYCFERDSAHPSGRTLFVATVPAADASGPNFVQQEASLTGLQSNPSQTTPNGRYLVFRSTGRLTPDDLDTAADIYRYDSQTGDLIRISVGNPGFPASNDGNTAGLNAGINGPNHSGTSAKALPTADGQAISTDGSYVVFSTAERLQGSDATQGTTGAECTGDAVGGCDVYVWHDGVVRLVSPGKDDSLGRGSNRGAISASGATVAFFTSVPILPQDVDNQADVYVARTDGGFGYTPPAVPCGDNETCHGAPPPAPTAGSAGSADFFGPANDPVPPAKKRHKHKHKKKHHKKHHHKNRTASGRHG